ncbi:MAG: hypothetical protein SOY76_02930 [Veillonella caviae]|nr:hypothetical protein [Veillonella caviae]
MTEIKCLHVSCLNNKQGKCIANQIDVNKRNYCSSCVLANKAMKHDYDLLVKEQRKWRRKKGCKK